MTEFIITTLGPNAPKSPFKILDQEGPRDERDLATVVNGAMNAKTNSINEIFQDIATIPADMTYMRVLDSRISAQSVIVYQPVSLSAVILVVGGQGPGYFDLIPNSIMGANFKVYGSGEHTTGGVWPGVPTILTLDAVGGLPLKYVTLANNRLVIQMDGLYRAEFSTSAFVIKNRTYFIDFVREDSGGTEVGRAQQVITLGSTADEIHTSVSGYIDMADGDSLHVELSNNQGTDVGVINIAELTLTRADNSKTYDNLIPPEAEAALGDILFKYAVIG